MNPNFILPGSKIGSQKKFKLTEIMIPGLLFILFINMTTLFAQDSWPDFRGPLANGHIVAGDDMPGSIPLHWSESENITWKIEIPHRGWSSPVIMDNQIWITTATADGHEYYAICVDAKYGEILYNEKIFHSDSPEPLGNQMNSYASPSPVIEAGRVYVHFGSYGTACIDTESFEILWQRNDLPCRHYRGPGSSPFIYEDFLILTMDGVDVQYLAALDKTTGETVWRTDRTVDFNDLDANGQPKAEGDFRKAYTTPIIITVDGKDQLISNGAKAAYSYDPKTGKELWRVQHPDFSGAARAVYGHGLVYIPTGFLPTWLLAVRPDGEGDITETHIAWNFKQGVSKMPSPLLIGDNLFWINDDGIAVCLNAKSGERISRTRVGGNFAASPIYAQNRIYCFDRDGKTTVLKADPLMETLAENELESGFMASPAVSSNALILRTETHLYRVESD